MNLNHLKYFVAVADNRSFTEASKKLFVSQPTLSHGINALEEELDCQLFIRKHHALELSEAGRKLYEISAEILRLVDKVYAEIKPALKDTANRLKIGFMGDLLPMLFSDRISQFLLTNPTIKTQLDQKSVMDLHDFLEKDMLDVAITRSSSLEDIPVQGTESIVLEKDNFCLVVPENNPLSEYNELSDLSVLKEESFIALSPERTAPLLEKITRICNQRNYFPNIEFTDYTLDAVLAKVSSDNCVTITPESYVRFKQYPRIKTITILPCTDTRNDIVACYKPTNSAPAVKAFINYLKNYAAGQKQIP